MKNRLFSASVCILLLSIGAAASLAAGQPGRVREVRETHRISLDRAFHEPPDSARPWVYWWWLKGNVTEASIKRDLEGMKRQGIGGLLLFDARGYHEDHVPPPESRMEFMSPEWRRMVKLAITEAGRLGLEVSVNLSSCAGALKGPWLVGNDAPKKLLWTSDELEGPRTLDCTLDPGRVRETDQDIDPGRVRETHHDLAGKPGLWEVAIVAARLADADRDTAKLPLTPNPSPERGEGSTADRNRSSKPGRVRETHQDIAKLQPSPPTPLPLAGEGSAETAVIETSAKAAMLSGPWQEAASALQGKATVLEVVDLSRKVDRRGRLHWDVPAGRWVVIRFTCALMEGHEYDVDILDPQAVTAHYERMGKPLLADAGPLAGKTLTHFYSVSWEGAAPTWTLAFEKEFQHYRGYDLRPYLPVLAGFRLKNQEVSARFLRDYHKTLGDCFMNNFYGTLRKLCNEAGLKWHSESGGPWNRKLPSFEHADQMAFLGRNDMPQGEFWHLSRAFNRPIAMASHLYGAPRAAAESFTHMQLHWSSYPATLKIDADGALCDGINHFIWHTFAASPEEFGLPGIVYFAGTHLNPNVTWWNQAPAFLRYLARCQLLLRQGKPVVDVCCYTGDKPYLHWGHGEKWSENPTCTLGKGYQYDLVNTEALLDRLSVRDGRLVLPDGMQYRVLVVDLEEPTAEPRAMRKIIELARGGATIVLGTCRPTSAPGLSDHPACDDEVRRLAADLWATSGERPSSRSLGKGKVITATSLDEVLRAEGIGPDFAGDWNFTHRRGDGMDVYFVSGQGQADCTFRVAGKEPELWDPVTGDLRDAIAWRSGNDGSTIVPISLPKNGSTFIVFRKPSRPTHLMSLSAPEGALEIQGRIAGGAKVRVWQTSSYTLHTSAGEQLRVDAKELPASITLTGPWNVRFQPGRGAPESAVFDQLIGWDQHPDPRIKYFSGTATYRKTFRLDERQAGGLVRLRLGQVGDIAEVRLNGKDLGVVWTDPWTAELTGVARPGENELEVRVTNRWINRLIGDAGLAPEQRLTKTNVLLRAGDRDFKPYEGFASKDPLMPSGLVGPVQVEFGQEREVRF